MLHLIPAILLALPPLTTGEVLVTVGVITEHHQPIEVPSDPRKNAPVPAAKATDPRDLLPKIQRPEVDIHNKSKKARGRQAKTNGKSSHPLSGRSRW